MNPFIKTRREFLASGLKGISLLAATSYVPAFLTRTAEAAGAASDSRILVVLQLSGGNDGLNTIIPYTDDLYYKARPVIGIKAGEVLKATDKLGLHPALRPIKEEFDKGHVAIVQNVGYPNPNRSHFRSMEIWQSGSDDTERREVTGWLGRYFDAQCSGTDPRRRSELGTIGLNFGKVMPQSFRNGSNVGLSLENPDTFLWNPSGETLGLAKAQEAIFARLNQPASGGMSTMRRSMESLGGIANDSPGAIDFLKHTAMNAVVAGDRIRAILDKSKDSASYPRSSLAQQFKTIGKLVAGNFPTRVYYAHQGGFDTHQQQLTTQERLLGDVAAGPMFFFVEKIKGGVHGAPPDLANLLGGDVKPQIDFRQVYAAILEGWLGTNAERVLGKKYEKVPFV